MDSLKKLSEAPPAEAQAMLDAAVEMVSSLPSLEDLSIADRRAMAPEPVRLDAGVEREANGVPVRVFVPDTVNGVYLYIHGGGWVGGAHDAVDQELWDRAQAARAAVVSVGYRLAPEHPYPAGPDDCLTAARWLIANAKAEFGTDAIVIGGESAGAHLSAVTLLRLRDQDDFVGFKGAELRYGCFDLRLTPSVRRFPVPVLDRRAIEWLLAHFVAPELRDDPDVSPLMADLRGLPPAYFTCGTYDSLLDDTLFMWARWRAAGNDAEIDIVPGGVHAFDRAPVEWALAAAGRISSWVGERLLA